MTEMILEQKAPAKPKTAPSTVQSVQAKEIAERLERLHQMEEFFKSLPNRRARAGLGPLPDDAIAAMYEEREVTIR